MVYHIGLIAQLEASEVKRYISRRTHIKSWLLLCIALPDPLSFDLEVRQSRCFSLFRQFTILNGSL